MLSVVTRIFQIKANLADYDDTKFNEVVGAIQNVLESSQVTRLLVVTNTDPSCDYAECLTEAGLAPTCVRLREAFPAQIASGKIGLLQATVWGANRGSGQALSQGFRLEAAAGASRLLAWSPELKLTGSAIARAVALMDTQNLNVVGFHRRELGNGDQYEVFQNTGALYKAEFLQANGYFSERCDNNPVTVYANNKNIPARGMEDFHLLLRRWRDGGPMRWGMVCRNAPLEWATPQAGSKRYEEFLDKKARQELVMRHYAQEILAVDGSSYYRLMEEIKAERLED